MGRAMILLVLAAVAVGFVGGCDDDDVAIGSPVPALPVVEVVKPVNGADLADLVEVLVSATDDKGIARVEFFVDTVSLGVDPVAPYTVDWVAYDWDEGDHILYAQATDTDDNMVGSSTVTVTIVDSLKWPQPSVITGFSDVQGSSLTITWTQNQDYDFYIYEVWADTASPVVLESPTAHGWGAILSRSDTTAVINGLISGWEYHFTVVTWDRFSHRVMAEERSITMP